MIAELDDKNEGLKNGRANQINKLTMIKILTFESFIFTKEYLHETYITGAITNKKPATPN